MTGSRQPLPGDGVPQLGPFPKGKERLVTTYRSTSPGKSEHLVRREKRSRNPSRRSSERAIATTIPAEPSERNKYLRRVSDPITKERSAANGGSVEKSGERLGEEIERHRVSLKERRDPVRAVAGVPSVGECGNSGWSYWSR